MALDDLNLEFEDEEEVKRKKNDAVQVDVDLEFQNPVGTGRTTAAAKPVAQAASTPVKPTIGGPNPPRPQAPSNVKNINDARPQPMGAKPQGSALPAQASAQPPRVAGANALQVEEGYSLESQELVETREQLKRVEFDAAVKVSVAEFKTDILSELNGDVKLLEHQISQLLNRINAKHADLKPEALAIKKLLADFTAKKRK